MTKRSKAAERIGTAFQRLIPRMILSHEQVAKDAGISGVALQVLHTVTLNPGPISPSQLSEQTGFPAARSAVYWPSWKSAATWCGPRYRTTCDAR